MSEDKEPRGGALESRDDSRQAAAVLADNVRRELLIFSRDLEAPVLDRSEFLDPLRQFLIRSRHTGLRVLLIDPTRAIREGHGLVRLAQRLPTHVSMHRPHEDDMDAADAFMVCDDRGFLYRTLADRLEGRWSENDPPQARRLRKRFDQMWERSEADPEFRRLGT